MWRPPGQLNSSKQLVSQPLYTGWSKKRNPSFNFAITRKCTMYTDFNHIFAVITRNVWRIKSKITPATVPPHLYSVTPYLAKHTLLLISMLRFWMCNIFNVYPKEFSSTYSILAYLFTAMLCDDTITSNCVYAQCLMVLIKQRSFFVILPILNHVKRLKPLQQKTLPINTYDIKLRRYYCSFVIKHCCE